MRIAIKAPPFFEKGGRRVASKPQLIIFGGIFRGKAANPDHNKPESFWALLNTPSAGLLEDGGWKNEWKLRQ